MKGTLAITFIAILCLSMLSAYEPKAMAQQSSGGWPMFRADPSHSGVETGNPVLTPRYSGNTLFAIIILGPTMFRLLLLWAA